MITHALRKNAVRHLACRSQVAWAGAQRWNSVDSDKAELIYEGPFSQLASRLKMVSVTTALLSVVGVPLLINFYQGDVPDVGIYSVGGVSVACSVGSTFVLDFAFSSYVIRLERIPIRKCHNKEETVEECAQKAGQEYLLKATTRNILAMQTHTVFDPTTDITEYSGLRPFANITAKGKKPLFIHPELIDDQTLRVQLFGEEPLLDEDNKPKIRKDDEDEFI